MQQRQQNIKQNIKKKAAGNQEKRQNRNTSVCPYAKKCGGCDYQGVSYKEQLVKKQAYMRKLMEPFGRVNPIVGMDDPYHYRHKVQAAFDCTRGGRLLRECMKRGPMMWWISRAARLRMRRQTQSFAM